MFEKALRMKLRFSYKGLCSTEDLWDLSVSALDTIYKGLVREAKAQEEESLLNKRSNANKELDLKIEIVKHIVVTKLAEAEELKNAKEKAEQKQKILGIIESKQDEALQSKSLEELQALVNNI